MTKLLQMASSLPPPVSCFTNPSQELPEELHQAFMEIERARQHSSLLARISTKLSSSLQYEINLARISQLIIPILGDWCFIDLINHTHKLETVHVSHVDPNAQSLANQLKSENRPSIQKELRNNAFCNAIPILLPRFKLESTLTEPSLDQEDIKIRSALIVPMILHDRAIGVLSLFITNSDREFNGTDLKLAEEIAYRSAIAINNAWLYAEAKSAISARDEFFSIVSHELKTPLNALSLQNQFLLHAMSDERREVNLKPKIEAMLKSGARSITQLTRLIEDLVDTASIQAGRLSISPEKVDLAEIIQYVAQRSASHLSENSCTLNMELTGPCIGLWDRLRIEQVITNLLLNAIKYAPGKEIRMSLRDLGTKVEIRVQDFGTGIPKEDQSKIFHKFERLRTHSHLNGLGLGLYIVDQIIRAHTGCISVESELGSGATFVVQLPKGVLPQHDFKCK